MEETPPAHTCISTRRESVVSTPQIKLTTNDTITPSPLLQQNVHQKVSRARKKRVSKKRRLSSRLRLANSKENQPKQLINDFFKAHKQGKQSTTVTLGKVHMQHERVAQELRHEPGSKVLQQRMKKLQTLVKNLKKRNPCSSRTTAKQVYAFLEQKFANCPWPIPPSALLMELPIEEIADKRTREQVLRGIIIKDKKWRHSTKWEFRDVRPYPQTL